MIHLSPDIWNRLSGEKPPGELLWARFAAPGTTKRLIAALDGNARRHFLVHLNADEEELQDIQSRGLGVTTRLLALPNHEAGKYLDVICNDPSGHDAFDIIGAEIADRIAKGDETPAEIVARVFAKWRRFWGQVTKQVLSNEELKGLFAELWFLSTWLIPKVGPEEAISRWRGPYGSRHDFEWPGKSIEVKATTSIRGRLHHINGLDQLEPPDKGYLMLFSLRLREESSATNTLPSIIVACRALLDEAPRALDQFERGLAQANYSPAHENEYSQLHLRIVDEVLFRVEENFPKLTPESFRAGIPKGIERIEYEINLDGFDHLILAKSAAAMPLL